MLQMQGTVNAIHQGRGGSTPITALNGQIPIIVLLPALIWDLK